jgi:hypothetical protein
MKFARSHIALGAGLAGGLLGLALVSGVGPAPALSGTSSDGSDDGTTSTTAATLPTGISGSTTAGATDGTRVVDAGGAGTVTVAQEGGSLRLLAAEPADGWTVEVEESAGREVEVDFRRGTERVQVNVELEDGAVRERVRFRDRATGEELLVEDGVVIGTDDGTDDRGGRDDDGTEDRGPGNDDDHGDDDHDDDHDDDDHGGHGDDDTHDDTHDDDHGGRGEG